MGIGIMEIAVLAIIAAVVFGVIWWYSTGSDKDQE